MANLKIHSSIANQSEPQRVIVEWKVGDPRMMRELGVASIHYVGLGAGLNLNYSAYTLDHRQIRQAAENPNVVRVWPDRLRSIPRPLIDDSFYHVDLVDSVPLIGADKVWDKGITGKGVRVCIVDTGIDAMHPDFVNRILAAKDFTDEKNNKDGCGHGCVSPNDLVYTSLCGLQKIETLFNNVPGIPYTMDDGAIIKDVSRYGINTLSFDGENIIRSKVLAVHKLPYAGKVYNVKTFDSDLTLTPWHPIYVETSCRGIDRTIVKKRADELVVGDRIVASVCGADIVDSYLNVPYRTIWKCRFCGYVARGEKSTQCHGCHKLHWHDGPINETKVLDEDMAYFLGLVSSDGHLMKLQKTIEFSNTNEEIVNQFAKCCESICERKPKRFADRRYPEVIRQRLYASDVYTMVANTFGVPIGHKSQIIKFPDVIAKSKRSVICAFIAGYIEGNGCVSCGKIRVITGSKEFAYGLSMICKTLGYRSSVSCQTTDLHPGDTYYVCIGTATEITQYLRCKRVANDLQYKPRKNSSIEEIVESEYDGLMYDLTIDGTHNYVANGLVVSNTHCAGIAGGSGTASNGKYKGIAPECSLLAAKVLDKDGSGYDSDIIAGLEWAYSQKAHIASLSLGADSNGDGSDPLSQACDALIARGVVVTVAAGNAGPASGTVGIPACAKNVIAVGATTKSDKVADFSSRGPTEDNRVCPTLCLPGVNITAALSSQASPLGPTVGKYYQTISGTSMATPHAAGAAALMLQAAPGRSPARIKSDMMASCKSLDGYDDNAQGAGRLDVFWAYQRVIIDDPAPKPTDPFPWLPQGCSAVLTDWAKAIVKLKPTAKRLARALPFAEKDLRKKK